MALHPGPNDWPQQPQILQLPTHLPHWSKLRSYLVQLQHQRFVSAGHLLQSLYHLEQLFHLPNYQIPLTKGHQKQSPAPTWIKRSAFIGLCHFLKQHATNDERQNFLTHLVQHIIAKVLQLDQSDWRVPYLTVGSNSEMIIPWQLNRGLLAAMFLCLIPPPTNPSQAFLLNDFNFSRLFKSLNTKKETKASEKLRAVLHYFERSRQWDLKLGNTPAANVEESLQLQYYLKVRRKTFAAVHVDNCGLSHNAPRDRALIPLLVDGTTVGMQYFPSPPFLQVDFAAAYLGGGVIGNGCVQEEIQLISRPSLLPALLVTQRLEDHEVVSLSLSDPLLWEDATAVHGCIPYRGYDATFHCLPDNFQEVNYADSNFNRQTLHDSHPWQTVAMDAVNFNLLDPDEFTYYNQYSVAAMQRDLVKAFTAFADNPLNSSLPSESPVYSRSTCLNRKRPLLQRMICKSTSSVDNLAEGDGESKENKTVRALWLYSNNFSKAVLTSALSEYYDRSFSPLDEDAGRENARRLIHECVSGLWPDPHHHPHHQDHHHHHGESTVLRLWAEDMSQQLLRDALDGCQEQISREQVVHHVAEHMSSEIMRCALHHCHQQRVDKLHQFISTWCASQIAVAVRRYAHVATWAHEFCQRTIQEGIENVVQRRAELDHLEEQQQPALTTTVTQEEVVEDDTPEEVEDLAEDNNLNEDEEEKELHFETSDGTPLHSLRRRSVSHPQLSSLDLDGTSVGAGVGRQVSNSCGQNPILNSSHLDSMLAQQLSVQNQQHHLMEFERLLLRMGTCFESCSVTEHRTLLEALNLAHCRKPDTGMESRPLFLVEEKSSEHSVQRMYSTPPLIESPDCQASSLEEMDVAEEVLLPLIEDLPQEASSSGTLFTTVQDYLETLVQGTVGQALQSLLPSMGRHTVYQPAEEEEVEDKFEDCIDVPLSEVEERAEHWACQILSQAYWELNKKMVNSSLTSKAVLYRPVVTGNWGCGVFGGDAQLKCLLQWLSASETGTVPFLVYCGYGSPALTQLHEVVSHVRSWTCEQLYAVIHRYAQQRDAASSSRSTSASLFQYLLKCPQPPSYSEVKQVVYWRLAATAPLSS